MNNLRVGELKGVFDDLEEVFEKMEIDFYLIGALAREVWYAGSGQIQRTTKDVDFAVFIASKTDYKDVRNFMVDEKGYTELRTNAFVIISPKGIEIDLLPFGGIEIDDEVEFDGTGFTNIKVNGFMEVHESGTARFDLETGHSFRVATLPSIVLLKFIAYDDRPEIRAKDPRDIINIILHFFELQSDLIYENHSDLFGQEHDPSLEELAAKVIGREIRKMIVSNTDLQLRLNEILQAHIEQKENSALVRHMANEAERSVETILGLLKALFEGLTSEPPTC